jgi:spoIIIJ-associated protein
MAKRCQAVAHELVSLIGVPGEVTVHPGGETGDLVVAISGDSGGLLIGRRGQTLDALEYLINRIAGRSEDGATPRIVVDVEGYRERRQGYLNALARRLADKVNHTGRVVTLNPMSPRDRRIVHLALQDDQTVTTRSQGDGHYRRILILPAGRPARGPQS